MWLTGQAARVQIRQPDPRVLRLVRELSEGPLPNWTPPPCILVFNKVTAALIP